MEHVEVFLRHIGLGQYAGVFEDNGYDSLDMFFVMDDMDFQIFGPYIGMKPGHLQRLKHTVFRIKKQGGKHAKELMSNIQHSAVRIIDLLSHNGNNGNDEGAVDPAAAVDATAVNGPATAVNGPAVNGPAATVDAATLDAVWQDAVNSTVGTPTKRKRSASEIPHRLASSKQVRVESLRHSNQQGHSAMRDNKSGGNRIMYRCSSVLSKRVKAKMGPGELHESQKCKYCLMWRKKNLMYELDKEVSVMQHSPMCLAPQKVTRDELIHDSKFVHHSLSHDTVTGKNAQETATSHAGRMDGSVNERTAKRASNDVKRYHDKDYDEDWSKLRQWGREYENKNRNSRFHLQINADTNRCVRGPIHPRAQCPRVVAGPFDNNTHTTREQVRESLHVTWRMHRHLLRMWVEVCRSRCRILQTFNVS